jgi:hypothetical protein
MIDILDKYYPEEFWKLSDEYFKFYDTGMIEESEEFLNKYPALRRMDVLENAIDEAKEKRELYLQRGCIIGSVELSDIIKNSKSPFAEKNCYHWILKNPVIFDNPIVNIKGKLNFWDFDYVEGDI